MRVFLRKIVISFVFCLIVQVIIFVFLSVFITDRQIYNVKLTTGGSGYALSRYADAKLLRDVDILFCGSSHCYRGFDTRLFEENDIKSFNMGSSAQTPLNTYYLLKEYIDSIKTKILILETFSGTLSLQGSESSIDLISNLELTDNMHRMVLNTNDFETYKSYAYLKLNRILYPLNIKHQKEMKSDIYLEGGYVKTTKISNEKINYNYKKKNVEILNKQLNYIELIAKLCKENEIEFILMQTPMSKSVRNSITNFDEIDQILAALARKNSFLYVNFNANQMYDSMQLDVNYDWYDNSHLTQTGVNKFNKYLISKFINNGIFSSLNIISDKDGYDKKLNKLGLEDSTVLTNLRELN